MFKTDSPTTGIAMFGGNLPPNNYKINGMSAGYAPVREIVMFAGNLPPDMYVYLF